MFCKELVREFYANLTLNELKEVSARGIKVPISSNTINEFFELPDFEDDEYSSLMRNIDIENLQEILEELIVLGSKWTVSKQGIHTCRQRFCSPATS
ncbi:hypothetical protein Gogos_021517 [Gossypium gossypioides]|uniref:Putative plant transposon protein domain-containing protein n=1 Tax=Gossypium gossypioides TaxID=34282 RepID=A0A7J9D3A3_GOSGO|nr:hypothetical protein [Gossypium gossypioides]